MSDFGAGILIDTSATRKYRTLHGLCRLARERGVPVYVSAITHGEMLRHLRAEHGPEFSQSIADQAVRAFGLQCLDVDETVAEVFAKAVHSQHDSDEKWNRAKQAHCLSMLGLGDRVTLDDVSPNRDCSGTSDWFIAATAVAHGLRMVTEDTGPEFDICATSKINDAVTELTALTEDPP